MTFDVLESLWSNIKKEVRILVNSEPTLADFYHISLLQHKNFSSSLSYILANKLTRFTMSVMNIREIIDESYRRDPSIILYAVYDIFAILERDPAVNKYSTPLLFLKGFHALQAYRVSHWLWMDGRVELAVYLQNEISVSFSVDIHPAACIGYGIMLDHATGIVIGETTVIENGVSILQSVTLGGTGKMRGNRHPKICEGVMIGAGAKILGNIEIGRGAKVAAGSVVLKSVPMYTTVAGVPARIVGKSSMDDKFAMDMDQYFSKDLFGFECGDGI